MLTSAFLSISHWAVSIWPFFKAVWSGVFPSCRKIQFVKTVNIHTHTCIIQTNNHAHMSFTKLEA